jgi:hypothetical protein
LFTPVFSQSIPERNANQHARIRQGVRSGQLTPAEAARLERQQTATMNKIRKDRVDGGVFTPAEREQAQRSLNQQSRRIYQQKHDAQHR